MLALLLLAAGAGLVGCGSNAKVLSFWNSEAAELNPDQIVTVMRRANFSDEQIVRLGPDLRNALASYGGARIRRGGHTEAMFLVIDDAVYVAVSGGANLVYPLRRPPQSQPATRRSNSALPAQP